jgi:uncharacterized protein YecT (DUF1311 family)
LSVCRSFVKARHEGIGQMSGWSKWTAGGCLLLVLISGATGPGGAQDEKPTAQQTAAIRACAEKNQDDLIEAERQCLFNLVAVPCQDTEGGQSTYGMAHCFSLEAAIWDDLLNANYKSLREDLDAPQVARLREMQRAWIAARDATCAFYDAKIQGTIAIPMGAACLARETARRALLLKFFTRL